jgi:hypothetical protein
VVLTFWLLQAEKKKAAAARKKEKQTKKAGAKRRASDSGGSKVSNGWFVGIRSMHNQLRGIRDWCYTLLTAAADYAFMLTMLEQ